MLVWISILHGGPAYGLLSTCMQSMFLNHHFLQCALDIMLFSVLMKSSMWANLFYKTLCIYKYHIVHSFIRLFGFIHNTSTSRCGLTQYKLLALEQTLCIWCSNKEGESLWMLFLLSNKVFHTKHTYECIGKIKEEPHLDVIYSSLSILVYCRLQSPRAIHQICINDPFDKP